MSAPQPSLTYARVDPHSPIPLYYQVYLDLRQMIQRELIAPGDLLPPEMEICQAYGIGRQTVRQALARLVDENLVERFAGRGTFVRSKPPHGQFFLDRSFSQQMRELGCSPQSRVLRQETGKVGPESPAPLQAHAGTPCLTLERLRLGDGIPICIQVSTVLMDCCPGLEQQDFSSQSLYELLSTHYNISINRIDHVVRAVAADDYRADLLEVMPGSPLLFVGTTAYSSEGEPVEYSTAYYRADRYEYSTSETCCP